MPTPSPALAPRGAARTRSGSKPLPCSSPAWSVQRSASCSPAGRFADRRRSEAAARPRASEPTWRKARPRATTATTASARADPTPRGHRSCIPRPRRQGLGVDSAPRLSRPPRRLQQQQQQRRRQQRRRQQQGRKAPGRTARPSPPQGAAAAGPTPWTSRSTPSQSWSSTAATALGGAPRVAQAARAPAAPARAVARRKTSSALWGAAWSARGPLRAVTACHCSPGSGDSSASTPPQRYLQPLAREPRRRSDALALAWWALD
mmetsp:Transcript_3130/g.12906  ORF Transcript_3130/g.12906 Transcript_3130/m.12906 type:complete len:262 (-) Transcript_3130:911-1696(-)